VLLLPPTWLQDALDAQVECGDTTLWCTRGASVWRKPRLYQHTYFQYGSGTTAPLYVPGHHSSNWSSSH
jgi:hypothetical protein